MIVTYAGVELPRATPAHRELLEGRFRPSSINLWSRGELAARRDRWTFAGAYLNDRPITFDSIYWPTGAMRWAVAYFLVTETKLDEIRETTTFGGASTAAELAWGEGDEQLTTQMYMLPAVPVSQVGDDPDRKVYLLTLVDERYFWWYQKATIEISEPCDETWVQLYTAVGSALGITITADGIDSAYLKPCHDLSNRNDPLPQMLDAMAYSVGQRVVRKLDGTVTSQSYANAKAANDDLADQAWNRTGGYLLSLPSGVPAEAEPGDVSLLVPSSVVVSFPRYCSGWYDKEVTLASLSLSGFTGVSGFIGEKCFHDTAVASATTPAGTPVNQTQLDALATLHATDWYKWQTGRVQAVYACLRAVVPHGLIDSVEWVNDDSGIYTVVRRPPFDDKAEELLHCGSAGCSPECPSHICGRAEVKALTEGCVDSRVAKKVRLDICGRAEVKALSEGCVTSRSSSTTRGTVCGRAEVKALTGGLSFGSGRLILVKTSRTSAQTVSAGASADILFTDADIKDTHAMHDPASNSDRHIFTTAGKGWYHCDFYCKGVVTFAGTDVTNQEVKVEGQVDSVVVPGLKDVDTIARWSIVAGSVTTAHEDNTVYLHFSHTFEATTTSVIFRVKAFAASGFDTDFSECVLTIHKINRGGAVDE